METGEQVSGKVGSLCVGLVCEVWTVQTQRHVWKVLFTNSGIKLFVGGEN